MKVWEKRFRKLPDKEIEEFTSSFNEDNFLYPYDIEGSKAHVLMLEKAGYLTSEEKERLIEGLERVKKEMEEGEFEVKGDEDVHMAVERRLKELVGDVAEKLHTARSRNDQVVLDEKLFLKDKIPEIIERIEAVQKVILEKAEEYLGVVMAGFTHFRPAQPVLFSHWLMVYFWMLERDKGRFEDVLKRVDEFPGGSLALAGTSLAIDRQFMAEKLGFKKVSPNSMDAVSDRDFILEFLTASLQVILHLSRIAEELIIFSSPYFSWIKIPQEYMTGSSIMPQKMNPDVLELIRGRTGRILGYVVSMSTVMKGLPLTYNRDLQEDKIPLWEGYKLTVSILSMMKGIIEGMEVEKGKMEGGAKGYYLVATDIVERLVEKGMAFRSAYRKVGEVVKKLEDEGREFSSLTQDEWKKYFGFEEEEVKEILSFRDSVERKKVLGGTATSEVRKEIEKGKKLLKKK